MADVRSTAVANPTATSVRSVSDQLRHASDAKILKITRMIDLLPDRGEADLLLQPVRDRLAALRPNRPMTRTRLLFVPVDQVLVSAASWRAGDLTIPRSIIGPLSALLPGPKAEALPTFDETDAAALTRIGASLWAAMAERLSGFAIPDEWDTTAWQKQNGLTVPMVRQLVTVLRLVLSHAVEIRSLPMLDEAACEPLLIELLSDAAQTGPLGWGIMLALLLDLAAPDQVTRAAIGLARGNRFATALHAGLDTATINTLGRMEALMHEPLPDDLLDPARLTARVGLIERIEKFRRLDRRPAGEQRQVGRIRQALAITNRMLFERTIKVRLPGPPTSADGNTIGSEDMCALEAEARELRRFALAAAKLGDGETYDRLLEDAASRYNDAGAALTPADRLRLTELLVGSERAIQALGIR